MLIIEEIKLFDFNSKDHLFMSHQTNNILSMSLTSRSLFIFNLIIHKCKSITLFDYRLEIPITGHELCHFCL